MQPKQETLGESEKKAVVLKSLGNHQLASNYSPVLLYCRNLFSLEEELESGFEDFFLMLFLKLQTDTVWF